MLARRLASRLGHVRRILTPQVFRLCSTASASQLSAVVDEAIGKVIQEDVTDAEPPLTFASLGLGDELWRVLAAKGIETPSPVQAAAIPVGLAGSDVLAQARTGTGKTLAFGLPMLQRLHETARSTPRSNEGSTGRRCGMPRGVILAPTRELAIQVEREMAPLAHSLGQKMVCVYGGADIRQQIRALRSGVDVVVATPGRLLDLLSRKSISFEEAQCLVLDEADQMLDMGFEAELNAVLEALPEVCTPDTASPKKKNKKTKKHLRNTHTHSLCNAYAGEAVHAFFGDAPGVGPPPDQDYLRGPTGPPGPHHGHGRGRFHALLWLTF